MTEMVRMSADQHAELAYQMKLANTARLKGVVDALEPYVDGSLGPVSPAHVNAYVKTCRELGLLWDAYSRPAESAEGEDEGRGEPMVLEARQASVLAELGKLREVGMRRRPGSSRP